MRNIYLIRHACISQTVVQIQFWHVNVIHIDLLLGLRSLGHSSTVCFHFYPHTFSTTTDTILVTLQLLQIKTDKDLTPIGELCCLLTTLVICVSWCVVLRCDSVKLHVKMRMSLWKLNWVTWRVRLPCDKEFLPSAVGIQKKCSFNWTSVPLVATIGFLMLVIVYIKLRNETLKGLDLILQKKKKCLNKWLYH